MEKVIIFSAPSGSGKTTLVKYALSRFPDMAFSVSCTTRAPRGTEKNGVDYHFLMPEEFRTKIAEDAFVEYEEVYSGLYYGTLKSEVERIWNAGKTVIFDVDVKGGISLKNYFGDKALSLFIMAPSVKELENRLKNRGTEDAETIKMRVAKAEEELRFRSGFDKTIINADLATAEKDIEMSIKDFLKH